MSLSANKSMHQSEELVHKYFVAKANFSRSNHDHRDLAILQTNKAILKNNVHLLLFDFTTESTWSRQSGWTESGKKIHSSRVFTLRTSMEKE